MPYDRGWIYRATRGGAIVDVIWAMANHSAVVDVDWLSGPVADFWGERIRVVPPEEMLWAKLYVLQRDRCDWPDVLNLIDAQLEGLQWARLLGRLGNDIPLLGGVLSIYRWLFPERSVEIPGWVWTAVQNNPEFPISESQITRHRAALLDRRPWLREADRC
jgi:hypothetical protein